MLVPAVYLLKAIRRRTSKENKGEKNVATTQTLHFCSCVIIEVGAFSASSEAFERRDGEKILVSAQRQAANHDPSVKYNASIRTMQQAMYDALLKYEGTPPRITPWLGEKFDVSDDGLTYTFHLVKNAKFHNGDPVTAEAVRWSFERTLTIGKGPSWMLKDFLQASNITVVDDHTVKFKLDRPFAAFTSFLPWWYIMNPAQVMANEVTVILVRNG